MGLHKKGQNKQTIIQVIVLWHEQSEQKAIDKNFFLSINKDEHKQKEKKKQKCFMVIVVMLMTLDHCHGIKTISCEINKQNYQFKKENIKKRCIQLKLM